MINRLPDSPLDIIGDIHGEAEALKNLLHILSYDAQGRHPTGRRLVFVGDLCDRGPGSPAVINTVRRIVEAGYGQAILGNHELNLLRGERKPGNDWYWDEKNPTDSSYEPFQRIERQQRNSVLNFLTELPLALEREDLRIVHAAWHNPSIDKIKVSPPMDLKAMFEQFDQAIELKLSESGLLQDSAQEKAVWKHALGDPEANVPLLKALGTCDEQRQMGNPLRVLTSGFERLITGKPFYSSGKWRFAERVKWWDEYEDKAPVVVGHYWRTMQSVNRRELGKGDPNLFADIHPTAWHGRNGNVFCVDYSVGGRFMERRKQQPLGTTTKLTALRWPERTLVLDTGEELPTRGFNDGT